MLVQPSLYTNIFIYTRRPSPFNVSNNAAIVVPRSHLLPNDSEIRQRIIPHPCVCICTLRDGNHTWLLCPCSGRKRERGKFRKGRNQVIERQKKLKVWFSESSSGKKTNPATVTAPGYCRPTGTALRTLSPYLQTAP